MPRSDNSSSKDLHKLLSFGGTMGQLIADHDWSSTPVGSSETWPDSLRISLSTCLGSRLLSAVLWGPDHCLLYNEAYAEVLADRHPQALGRPIIAVLAEIEGVLAPQLAQVRDTGRGFVANDQMLVLKRGGCDEETYWPTASPRFTVTMAASPEY